MKFFASKSSSSSPITIGLAADPKIASFREDSAQK
jgi:hypothetical protein